MIRPLSIGSVALRNNLVMAPMAGITDQPFRRLARRGGAGMVCTEMVSAKALVYGDGKTRRLLQTAEDERPVCAQLFGADPGTMAGAARIAEQGGVDIIDINFGCPVRKIVKAGAGVKLLENESLMNEVMAAVVSSVKIPVTIKIRIGLEPGENIGPRIAEMAARAGVAMMTVHGRPAVNHHSGRPDLSAVAETVRASGIPVVGNGGVTDERSAEEFFGETGCAGLMLGRGAIGDPWLFRRIEHYLTTGEVLRPPSWEERVAVLKEHAAMSVAYYGERNGLIILRKVAAYYLKGLPHASRVRERFNHITSLDELDGLVAGVWQSPHFDNEGGFHGDAGIPA